MYAFGSRPSHGKTTKVKQDPPEQPSEDKVINFRQGSVEHRARIRLALECIQPDNAGRNCACALMTEYQVRQGNPEGTRTMKTVAAKAGYQLIDHKDAEPEPLEFDDSDLVDMPQAKRPAEQPTATMGDHSELGKDTVTQQTPKRKRLSQLNPNALPFVPSQV